MSALSNFEGHPSQYPVIRHPGKSHFEGFKSVTRAPERTAPAHSHPMGYLLYVYDGRMAAHNKYGITPLTAGDFFYTPKDFVHTEVFLSELATVGIIKIPDELYSGLPDYQTAMKAPTLLKALFEEVISWGLVAEHSPEQKKIIDVFVDQLMICQPVQTPPLTWPKDAAFRKIAFLIAKDPGKNRTVDEWASKIGMSPRTFARKFQMDTGISFLKWHNRLKVAIAMKQLSSGLSIKSVAHGLGFKSPGSLNHLFRLHAGFTPTDFLKLASAEPDEEMGLHMEPSVHNYEDIVLRA